MLDWLGILARFATAGNCPTMDASGMRSAVLPRFRRHCTLVSIVFVAACNVGSDVAPATRAPAADVVLTNGKVLTVDPYDSIPEALAIRDGRIVQVGTASEVAALVSNATRTIDLRGHSHRDVLHDMERGAVVPQGYGRKPRSRQVCRSGCVEYRPTLGGSGSY
jgi:hypothetical protein